MASQALSMIVPQLQSLFDDGSVAGLSDEQLLARFNASRGRAGEAAFAALLERHGPMVLGLCRRLIGDLHLAEDAFQAVFLVLARKASSLRNPELLGNWLYGVTVRVACNARRSRGSERESVVMDGSIIAAELDPTLESVLTRESFELLHDEIDRLPRNFRLPVVLCYLEGLSLDDAAARLQWPQGTLRSRLARARDKLRHRLERRGLALSTAALAAVLASRSSSAAVSKSLSSNTLKVATGALVDGAVSTSAAILAEEVLRAGTGRWFASAAKLVLLVSALGGAAYFALAATRSGPDGAAPPPAIRDEPEATPRRTIVGSVVDPNGRPVAGAFVDVVGRLRVASVKYEEPDPILGSATTGPDGLFRIEASFNPKVFQDLHVLARKPGFGHDWALLALDSLEGSVALSLSEEKPVEGILRDFDGRPVQGASIRIQKAKKPTRTDIFMRLNRRSAGLRGWPQSATTDQDGRFVLRGTGRGTTVDVTATDDRFPSTSSTVKLSDQDDPAQVILEFPQIAVVEGRVLAHETGLPLPRSVVLLWSFGKPGDSIVDGGRAETDEQGRFKTIVRAGYRFRIHVLPAPGRPYFAATRGDFASLQLQTGVLQRVDQLCKNR